MNDTSIGAAPREQDPAPTRKERRGAVPPLLDASRFEQALQRGKDRGDRRDPGESDAETDGANVVGGPAMPMPQPPLLVDSAGGGSGGIGEAADSPRGSRRAIDELPPDAAPATAPSAAPPPRPEVISPRDPAGAVTPPSPTLHALAHAGAAPRADGQWRFEIDPQPLQQGLTLHAERVPSNLPGMPVTGAPAWSLQLHMPVALASSASAAGRDRLEQRLRRSGIALHGLELHGRQQHHGEGNDDDE